MTIIRNNQIQSIHYSNLLTGDIVFITEGMEIPCDGLIIEANEIYCDESAMTGETEPMIKKTLPDCIAQRNEYYQIHNGFLFPQEIPSPLIFSGSKVLQGEGKFVVLVSGPQSCVGRIQEKLEIFVEITPLQQKLEKLAKSMGFVGMIFALLIFAVLMIRFTIERVIENNFDKKHFSEIVHFVLIAVKSLIYDIFKIFYIRS